jgi:hypothetical protein
MIQEYVIINNEIHIIVDADKENILMWGGERIPCYEVQNISFEMQDNNRGVVGSSFFISDYSMFDKASNEQKQTVDKFLAELSSK